MVIDGMIDAKQMMVVPQDQHLGAVPFSDLRMILMGLHLPGLSGIDTYRQDQYKHIFHKGNDSISRDAGQGPEPTQQRPGLYISQD